MHPEHAVCNSKTWSLCSKLKPLTDPRGVHVSLRFQFKPDFIELTTIICKVTDRFSSTHWTFSDQCCTSRQYRRARPTRRPVACNIGHEHAQMHDRLHELRGVPRGICSDGGVSHREYSVQTGGRYQRCENILATLGALNVFTPVAE